MRTKEQSRVDEPDGNMDRYEVKRKIGKVSIKISVIKFDDINLNRNHQISKNVQHVQMCSIPDRS